MSLTIDIHNQKQIWHPGDVVSGKLLLNPSKQINVGLVVLVLEGKAQARTSERNQYAPAYGVDVCLFRKKVVLFRGPFTLASPQEWPFTLEFPEDCRYADKRGIFVQPQHAEWLSRELAQSLPPSMAETEGNFAETSDVHRWVRYWLRAELVVLGMHTNIERSTRLRLMPYRDESMRNPVPKHYEVSRQRCIKSIHLDPEVGDRDLSLKEKFKTTFTSVPSVNYNIIVQFPDRGILGEPPQILVAVRPVKADSKETLPQVELKSFSVHVVRKTGFHIKQGDRALKHEDQLRSCTQESNIARWTGSVVIDGKLDLRKLYQRRPFDWTGTVPDFSTFNLYENHTLKLKMEIEVAREKSEVVIPGPPFTVLSPYCRTVGDSNVPAPLVHDSSSIADADPMEGDSELPSYEDHVNDEPVS